MEIKLGDGEWGADDVDFSLKTNGCIEELDVGGETDLREAAMADEVAEAETIGPVLAVLSMWSLLTGRDPTGGKLGGTLVEGTLIPGPPEDEALITAAAALGVVRVDSGTKGV